jgi:hypothetical protein
MKEHVMKVMSKSIAVFALCSGLMFVASQASAKCNVTLKFKNNDKHEITVLGNKSKSRVNGGTYSKMNFNNVKIKPGAVGSTSWRTNMSCGGNAKRDLKFKYQDGGDSNIYSKMVDNVNIEDGLVYGPYGIKTH